MADPMMVGGAFAAQVLAVSAVGGFVGSLLGLGGGLIVVPTLTLWLGVDIRHAIGASLVAIIATSSGAAAVYVRDRYVNLRLAMLLEVLTVAGALCGAAAAGLVPARALHLVFAGVVGYSCWVMGRARDEELPEGVVEHRWAARLGLSGAYPDARLKREVPYAVANVPLGMGLMALAGVASGMLGIGSGVFKVPAMDRGMRLPLKVSTATSNFMIGVTAAAGAWVWLSRGEVLPLVAAPVALGVFAGSTLGARLLPRLPNALLRRVFVVALSLMAVQMAYRGLR